MTIVTIKISSTSKDRYVELTYSRFNSEVKAKITTSDHEIAEVKRHYLPRALLRATTNVSAIESICKNAYSVITMLSDGEYKFYLYHRLYGGAIEEAHVVQIHQILDISLK